LTDPAPIHLRPAAPLAERVLLPGDPHRALAVAQEVLDEPKMFNHHRGLWGYTGRATDGEPLTVQSTGMGGPSAAIVVEELIDLGARTLLRIGTCGALRESLELGDLVTAAEVVATDGTSAALGAGTRLEPDAALLEALLAGGAPAVTALSTDLFYDPRADPAADWLAAGADVVEMEAAALLAVAGRRGAAAAVVLGVTDLLAGDGRERISRDRLEQLGLELGRAGWAALARLAPTASRR
jgi:uridine phosphorylase